jgi:hypothetical protein
MHHHFLTKKGKVVVREFQVLQLQIPQKNSKKKKLVQQAPILGTLSFTFDL